MKRSAAQDQKVTQDDEEDPETEGDKMQVMLGQDFDDKHRRFTLGS